MDAHEASQLLLNWQDQHRLVTGSETVLLGRLPLETRPETPSDGDGVDAIEAEFIVEREHTSRLHARIVRRNQTFVLIDESTNGTFVQTEDEQITFVRRGEIRLWGSGWITLGEPLRVESAIRFQHT